MPWYGANAKRLGPDDSIREYMCPTCGNVYQTGLFECTADHSNCCCHVGETLVRRGGRDVSNADRAGQRERGDD